jgi:hypothetical protein
MHAITEGKRRDQMRIHSAVPLEKLSMSTKGCSRSWPRILVLGALASLAATTADVTPALADLSFTLDQSACCNGGGSPPFGTILLHQVDANTVQVTETLVSGVEFVNTGAGEAIVFNTEKPITLSGITSDFTQDPTPPPGGISASPFGNFDYGIICTGCGSGGSSPLPGPLSFRAADGGTLSLTDFVANADGYFFASDIINTNASGRPTGNVATKMGQRVPEPASLALLGTALAGLGLLSRRRRSA